jgi:S1-C subfamily serine protease
MWPAHSAQTDSPFAGDGPPPPARPADSPFAEAPTPVATERVARPAERRRRPGRRAAATLGLASIVATAGAGGAWAGATILAPRPIVQAAPAGTAQIPTAQNPTTLVPVAPVSVNAPTVAETVVPSIVYIEVSATGGFGGSVGGAQPIASGSGVVIDADGHIVTNRHVVETGSSYRVVLSDGRTYDATLVGEDAATDLAVLDIDASDLTPIAVGSTDSLRIGGTAIAVGSPLGLEGGPSLTVGVLSATGREVQTDRQTVLYGMLQTDAAITEGSSGGALVDEQGRLIGITTAVGVSSVGVEGIGFATPVEIVTRVVDELIANGEATTAGLGIQGQTAYTDLPDGGEQPTGVEVRDVQAGSAAAAAGLRAGDVITQVDGIAVDTMDELISLLRRHSAGDQVTLRVERDGATDSRPVTLGAL